MIYKAVKRHNDEEGYEATSFVDSEELIKELSDWLEDNGIDDVYINYENPDYPYVHFNDSGREIIAKQGEVIVLNLGKHFKVMSEMQFFKKFYLELI